MAPGAIIRTNTACVKQLEYIITKPGIMHVLLPVIYAQPFRISIQIKRWFWQITHVMHCVTKSTSHNTRGISLLFVLLHLVRLQYNWATFK